MRLYQKFALMLCFSIILTACSKNDSGTKNETPKQPDSGIVTEEIKNLPENSAIKQASRLGKEERRIKTESMQQQTQKWQTYDSLIAELGLIAAKGGEWSEDGRYYEYHVFKTDKFPAYPQCPIVSHSEENEKYIYEKCPFESFVIDRVAKNPELKNAFSLAKKEKILMVLFHRFEIFNGHINIDINANDQAIIDFLTKDAKNSSKN